MVIDQDMMHETRSDVAFDGVEMLFECHPHGLARLGHQVRDQHALAATSADGVDDSGYEQNGHQAREQAAGPDDDEIGVFDGDHDTGGGLDVGR